MSIVISPSIRLVITDSDVTNFDYDTNQATELAILKDISVEREMTSIVGAAERVSETSNRVSNSTNTGYNAVKLKFSCYIKPVVIDNLIISAEQLLWESLSATDIVNNVSTSSVIFTEGNTNKLRELYFYLIYEDGTYYKIKQGVVASVTIAMDIKEISKATWEILALDMEYVGTDNLTGTPRDFTPETYIRNKLSTVALSIDSTDYDVALLKGNLTVKNNVKIINRVRVGEILTPTGHYTGDRTTSLNLSFYLNTKTDGSSTLLADLLAYTTLPGVNTLTDTTLSIGGSSNSLKVDVAIPTAKIKLTKSTIGLFNTVDVQIIPQESSIGEGDEISFIYHAPNTNFAATRTIPIDWKGFTTLNIDRNIAIEWKSPFSFSTDRGILTEWDSSAFLSISRELLPEWDTLIATVVIDRGVLIDWALEASGERDNQIDWSLQVSVDETALVEWDSAATISTQEEDHTIYWFGQQFIE